MTTLVVEDKNPTDTLTDEEKTQRCLWIAVDENGRCYVYREFSKPNQYVSDAAQSQLDSTMPDERIGYTIAPPDLWARNRETGKSQAYTFTENGVPLLRADNNRMQGWYALKELLKIRKDGRPGLVVFETCKQLIDSLKVIQHDKTNPNDVAKIPHEITHGPDALRYFAQTFVLSAEKEVVQEEYDDEDTEVDYFHEMCGTGVTRSYILA